MNMPIYLNQAAIRCNLGSNLDTLANNLFGSAAQVGQFLTRSEAYSPGRPLPLGLVNDPLPAVAIAGEDTRNNRLLAAAVGDLLPTIEALKSRYGSQRLGLVIGASTSGIAEGEAALIKQGDGFVLKSGYQYASQEFSAPARFLARWLELDGPAWVVSTACTSGGKALAAAARLLALGVCDAVIAGGVDTLCKMTVAGFSSLQVTSDSPCNPFSVNRKGINIGEAAALFIVSREQGPVRLAGVGETSDAYHISAPDPTGKGAEAAMIQALNQAGLKPGAIDYLNMHGTATAQNDLMEAVVVNRLFGADVPCGSTKGLTGHTLAAAGAVEALFCWQLLQRQDGMLPHHAWDGAIDPAFPALHGLAQRQLARPAHYAMSNSFAFGGNNLSLILARE